MNKQKLIGLVLALILMFASTAAEVPTELIESTQVIRSESEDNMLNIPVINIGGTDYNVKDAFGRQMVTDLQTYLKRGMNSFCLLGKYFYKDNIYIGNDGSEISAPGVSVYKLPVKANTVVLFRWDERFIPNSFSFAYVFRLFDANGNCYIPSNAERYISEAYGNAIFNFYAEEHDYTYLSIVIGSDTPEKLSVAILDPSETEFQFNGAMPANKMVYSPSEANSIKLQIYAGDAGYGAVSPPGCSLWFTVKAGDVLDFKERLPSGWNWYGGFIGPSVEAGKGQRFSTRYTFTEDGVAYVFGTTGYMENGIIYPKDSNKIEYKNIIGIPIIPDVNAYDGLEGVAFGTSLTANSLPGRTGGYLTYLPELSGISFDNRGSGGATILPYDNTGGQIYDLITSYSGYSGKNICLIEGFVNDWYYNAASLGTWKDTALTSVCGRVRAAINHIFTQNPSITVFLILDHFGKSETSSTTLNSANLTQYEYYQEIEKVALSMGVRVIREYEASEISERTPQYLRDNIHLTDLGCQQSAIAIWSVMKQYYPNAVLLN